jgi:hypothetical protein
VDHTIGLVAVIPGYGGDAAVFDSSPHLHFPRNHVVFTGPQMFVSGNAGPLRAIYKYRPVTGLLSCRSNLKSIPGYHLSHGS